MSRFLLLLFRDSYASRRGYRTSLNRFVTPTLFFPFARSQRTSNSSSLWYYKPLLGGLALIAMCSSCVHAFDLDSFDSRDPPNRSVPLSTTSICRSNPDDGLLTLAPAVQQKTVTHADGMWILRIWTGEPGFIGGVMVVKRREGRGSRSWCRGDVQGDDLSPADEVCTAQDGRLRQGGARSQGREK